MSFSRMMQATDHVARLPDRPGAAEGYTPEVLKAIFDQGATQIKEYLNSVLLQELEATGRGTSAAEQLGSAWIEGLTGQTVHQQLCSLLEELEKVKTESQQALLGQIPDGSLTETKLDPNLAALIYKSEARACVHAAYTDHGDYRFVAPIQGRYRLRVVGAGGGGTLCCPQAVGSGGVDATGGPSGAYAETTVILNRGQILSVSVGQGGVPAQYDVAQVLSNTEYYGNYIGQMLYSSPGGESAVYITAEQRLVAPGGDCTMEAVKAQAHGSWEERAVTRSGLRCATEADKVLRQGADSFLGQGGYGDTVGIGAGGAGGRLSLDTDGNRRIVELPTRGGDGAVFIDFLGGEV